MTTKELFEEVISKRMWYKNLEITERHANQIKYRFKNGLLSEGKMYELLVELGYKYKWKI